MRKVSHHLPMMPNFGGECKTTGLKRECGPGRLEKSAETLEFDRIMLAVFVRKDFQALSISDSRGPTMGNQ